MTDNLQKSWHALSVEETLHTLELSIEQGLASSEVQKRYEKFGPNELIEKGAKNPWRIFLDQFKETMVIVLIIAAVISAFISDWKDAIAILVIVILNAVLGFVQEYRAEQAMQALKKMTATGGGIPSRPSWSMEEKTSYRSLLSQAQMMPVTTITSKSKFISHL